ncbi:MAG: hypothetical protein WC699_17130 [Bacteroidales bacterium]
MIINFYFYKCTAIRYNFKIVVITKALKDGKEVRMDKKLKDLILNADEITANIILVYYSIK